MRVLLDVVVALVPVLAFLGLLVFLDSFKLVSLRSVLLALVAGGLAGAAAAAVNASIAQAGVLTPAAHTRYMAPLLEEALKALWVVVLLRRRRLGFLVDAAILGFAVGAGFALLENLEYLAAAAGSPRPLLFLARGLGTAILHGATTGVFAILAKGLTDRHPRTWPVALLPGLLVAVAVHSLYNHFLVSPLLAAGLLLVGVPVVLVAVFDRSERATRAWLGVDLDGELELVESLASGQALDTRIGEYLRSLRERFSGEVVADMLCLLRIQTELAIRAKGLLLAREAGLEAPVGEDVRANLRELHYLESSIGRTGMLALGPVLRRSARDLWQVYLLEEAGRRERPA